MKIIVSTFAAAALLAVAGAAVAQEEVAVTGNAERFCTLPSTWNFVSAAGASGSQFSGTTWTIPESAFANNQSMAATGSEYAIRVRGTGVCNSSHSITVTSTNGGLATSPAGDPAPTGFAKRRNMNYQAYWSDGAPGGSAQIFGVRAQVNASSPGQTATANYVVSGSLAPPGNRAFDVRLGMPRGAIAAPLMAGAYSDNVVITIALAP